MPGEGCGRYFLALGMGDADARLLRDLEPCCPLLVVRLLVTLVGLALLMTRCGGDLHEELLVLPWLVPLSIPLCVRGAVPRSPTVHSELSCALRGASCPSPALLPGLPLMGTPGRTSRGRWSCAILVSLLLVLLLLLVCVVVEPVELLVDDSPAHEEPLEVQPCGKLFGALVVVALSPSCASCAL